MRNTLFPFVVPLRRVCGGKKSRSKYIACERDKYINVNLQQVSWSDNSALERLTNADREYLKERANLTMAIHHL